MSYNSEKHHRRSIRLKGYDYSQPGAYFVTICTHQRDCLFGSVINGQMILNEYGKIVEQTWFDLVNHVGNVELDAFVVMPNHVHGIIIIIDNSDVVGAGSEPAPTLRKSQPLPEIVRQFKTFSAKRINQIRRTAGVPVWQRNYYEHIIRQEEVLQQLRAYISENPQRWELDEHYQ